MWRKESSEPRRGKYLEPLGFGETQSPLVKGNSRATRPGGVPKPAGDLGNRTTGKVAGPGRWSSGAKDAEKSAGRLRKTGRGRCISYMQRPRPIVPDGPKSRAPTRRRGHFRPTARGRPGSAAVAQFAPPDGTRVPAGACQDAFLGRYAVTAGRRQARPPAIPRRPAALPAGMPDTRARGPRAAPGPHGNPG